MKTIYTVDVLRVGQERAYGDHKNEYLITITSDIWDGKMVPWVLGDDVEARIKREEAERAAGRMFGGQSPDALRKEQVDWAKGLVRTLCTNFVEKDDPTGNWASPRLRMLKIDAKAGTIRAFIVSEYTG